MAKPVYRRVLLKISGEALAGGKGTGLDFEMIGSVCDTIKECLNMGVQAAISGAAPKTAAARWSVPGPITWGCWPRL